MNKNHDLLRVLLYALVPLFALGQVGRLSLFDKPIYVYLHELLLPIISLLIILKYRKDLWNADYVKIAGLWFVVMLVSLGVSIGNYSEEANIIALLYLLRLITHVGTLILVMYHQSHSSKPIIDFRVIIGLTYWVGVSIAVQYVWYPDFRNISYLGWDPHFGRAVGLFFDPPLTISVLALLILLFLIKKIRMLYFLPLFVLSSLTYSRGGYIAGIVIAFIYGLLYSTKKQIIISLISLIIFFLFLPKGNMEGVNLLRTTSIEARAEDYVKGITIWIDHPVWGIGYNHIREEKDMFETDKSYGVYNPSHGSTGFHSSFLIILVTGGVVGLVTFCALLWQIAIRQVFLRYAIAFLSIISLFDNVLLHPLILLCLIILVASRSKKEQLIHAGKKP